MAGEPIVKLNSARYIKALRTAFMQAGNRQIAQEQAAYMRNLFPFFGIKTPERVALIKAFTKQHGYPAADFLEEIVKACYQQKEREFHYAAIHFTAKCISTQGPALTPLLEYLITHNSWWDSVDGLSSACVRPLFWQYPHLLDKETRLWVKSGNLWLQRSAIICQLGYRERTNEKVLFRNIKALSGTEEFFLNKGIGWALREYSKTHSNRVKDFISMHKLSPLSVREGSKYL